MSKLFLLLLLCVFCIAQEKTKDEDESEKIHKWRLAIQQLALGISRSQLSSEFTPENLQVRNLTVALNQQAGRFRAYVARAISQAVGTTVSICPDVDISDQAIMSVRKELTDLGWTVEWKTLAEHYSSSDPVNMELLWPKHLHNPCNGNRRAFRVEVPIKKK